MSTCSCSCYIYSIIKRMKQATLFNYDCTRREAGPSGIEVQDCQVSESESQPILSGELSEPCCEHENRPIAFEHSRLEVAITRSRPLADTEIYTLLTTTQDYGGQKIKHITFQRRWLKEYVWLRYGKSGNDRGGCISRSNRLISRGMTVSTAQLYFLDYVCLQYT